MSEKIDRRSVLSVLFGAGGVGVTAAATGLPLPFLRIGKVQAAAPNAHYVIMLCNSQGDPLNCNVPGTYDDDWVWHPPGGDFQPVELTFGTQRVRSARIWERLGPSVLERTAVIHHATRSQLHSELYKVLNLQGKTRGGSSIAEVIARHSSAEGELSTVQPNPIPVGDRDTLFVNAAPAPRLSPTALKSLLVTEDGDVFSQFGPIRDRNIDRISQVLHDTGNTEQRRLLDRMALSRREAAELGDAAGELLAGISDDGPEAQVRAAIAMFRLNVTPVISVNFDFGSDNHGDPTLSRETSEYTAGVDALAFLFQQAEAAGLTDRLTFASLNVFGRSLRRFNNGRTHNPAHNVMMLIGPNVQGGVFGGIEDTGRNGKCRAIDSRTGAARDDGDIPYEETLSSAAKTLACAVGMSSAAVDEAITEGTPIQAALR
ncbi:MAG: hypothetical protein AAGF12_02465 [Myxococcota bacterium]